MKYIPLIPHFYKVKLGYTFFFSYVLIQNIDCGYSLELPQIGSSNVPTINVLSKTVQNIRFFPIKFSLCTAEKTMLHGKVFVTS